MDYQQLLIRMEKREKFQEAELEILGHIFTCALLFLAESAFESGDVL